MRYNLPKSKDERKVRFTVADRITPETITDLKILRDQLIAQDVLVKLAASARQ